MNDVAYYPQYYPTNYYQPPVMDNLAQLRAGQYQQPMTQSTPQQSSMIWVNGQAEAMAYLVAPNSAVTLWDSNAPVVYLKQADASGKPTMKTYDLVERTHNSAQASQTPAVEYAPLSLVKDLEARLDALSAAKEAAKTKRATTKEDAE